MKTYKIYFIKYLNQILNQELQWNKLKIINGLRKIVKNYIVYQILLHKYKVLNYNLNNNYFIKLYKEIKVNKNKDIIK